MTEIEIANIIKTEISEDQFDNWHGISKDNLAEFLITPTRKQYFDSWTDKLVTKWLVLDESPNEKDGYQIVFDEETKLFGLATKSSKHSDTIGTHIGDYGSFIDTLNGM